MPIRTGQLEEHIVAEVAWAACCYVDWTGDDAFAGGPGRDCSSRPHATGRPASRWTRDGTAHIYGVIGPDEYHEPVDDNAFTNVMARWNLRRAADAVEAPTASTDAVRAELAAAGRRARRRLRPATGVYEQFAGFHPLEPLLIAEVAPRGRSPPTCCSGRTGSAAPK